MLRIIKYKNSDIIAVSEFTKNEILKYTNIDKDKIFVVHNGLEKKWKSLNKYNNNNDILYVGNMKKHKNINLLINAFNRVKQRKNMKLYLIGNINNDLDRESSKLIDINKNIILIDSISKEELLKYYNKARLFVFPSNYEGFGFTPLEAMACGCPVIATKTASIPEICCDAALYFEKNNLDDLIDKIFLLSNNIDISNEFVEKGYNVSKKYLWKNTTINTINNLKKLLSL